MKLNLALLSAAALAAFSVPSGAATFLPIPVTISGNVTASCSTATTGISFAFGDVVAKAPAATYEKSADVSVNCSSAVTYSFSTSGTGAATGTYTVALRGASTTENGFPQDCDADNFDVDPTALPDDPANVVTCNTTTPGANNGPATVALYVEGATPADRVGIDAMAARTGTDAAETVTVYAQLQDSADATKTPAATGTVEIADAQLYVVY